MWYLEFNCGSAGFLIRHLHYKKADMTDFYVLNYL